jgi:hypothetical protein
LHRAGDEREQLIEGTIRDEVLRDDEEPARRLLARGRDGSCSLLDLKEAGHHEDDGEIDGERDPVLRRPYRERVVGSNEEPVVGEEAEHCGPHADAEAAHGDATEDGDHEDEGRGGRRQVGSEQEEDGRAHDERANRKGRTAQGSAHDHRSLRRRCDERVAEAPRRHPMTMWGSH